MPELSENAANVILKMFPLAHQEEARQLLLAECGRNLPCMDASAEYDVLIDRIRLGVLKLSQGDFDALLRGITIAKIDWRDTLVAAGFGHSLSEHVRWAEQYLAVAS